MLQALFGVIPMNDLIEQLTQRQLLWQARTGKTGAQLAPSGYEQFDQQLNGGLPKQGVVSIQSQLGLGELRFLLNTLKALQAKQKEHSKQSRLLVFIQPPGQLCAEFFHHQGFALHEILVLYPKRKNEALWAAEQCLKSGACNAVLLWQQALQMHQVKRLQIACETGQCLHFLLSNSQKKSAEASLPVSLSMRLSSSDKGVKVAVDKRKGGWPLPEFEVDMRGHWPSFSVATKAAATSNVLHFAKAGSGSLKARPQPRPQR